MQVTSYLVVTIKVYKAKQLLLFTYRKILLKLSNTNDAADSFIAIAYSLLAIKLPMQLGDFPCDNLFKFIICTF